MLSDDASGYDSVESLWGILDRLPESSDVFYTIRPSVDAWLATIRQHPESLELVAFHDALPIEVQRAIASSFDVHAKLVLLMHRSLPLEILEMLSRDEEEACRIRVAEHPNTSRSTLERLLGDQWRPIRREARSRLQAGS